MTGTEQFSLNFIKAAHRVMGELQCNKKEFAEWMGIGKVNCIQILNARHAPTVEQGIRLCRQAGIDANWLFLNQGELTLKGKLETIQNY